MPAFVLGHNATAAERAEFPEAYQPGIDLNSDGDFADAGERTSLPQKQPATYFGEFFSFAPPDSRERLVDFDMSQSGFVAGVTFTPQTQNSNFRSLFSSVATLDENAGVLPMPGEEVRRVFLQSGLLIEVEGVLRLLDVALVSISAGPAGGSSRARHSICGCRSSMRCLSRDLPASSHRSPAKTAG